MTAPAPQPKARLLLAEDEKNIAAGIIYNLEKRFYEVHAVERGDTALECASKQPFDLIILDVMLPGMSGFDVCAHLRECEIHTPILMLTARQEPENRVKGIRLGADDYLAKPFNLEELIARIEALLRRRRWDSAGTGETQTVFKLNDVEFDTNLLQLRNKSRKIPLTAIETRLLRLFVSDSGKTFPRSQILKQVWGLHEETQTRTLDNFIMRLRQHLDDAGGSAQWIESVRGVGYRFEIRKK